MAEIITETAQARYIQCQNLRDLIQPIIDINYLNTGSSIFYSFLPQGELNDTEFDNVIYITNFNPQDIVDNNITDIRIYDRERINYIINFNDNQEIQNILSDANQYT